MPVVIIVAYISIFQIYLNHGKKSRHPNLRITVIQHTARHLSPADQTRYRGHGRRTDRGDVRHPTQRCIVSFKGDDPCRPDIGTTGRPLSALSRQSAGNARTDRLPDRRVLRRESATVRRSASDSANLPRCCDNALYINNTRELGHERAVSVHW